jgi:hypothetical protein
MNFHLPLDQQFDEMGYAYANDNGSPLDKETLGCIELWCAVIEVAFRQSIEELKRWLGTPDFGLVCEMAGVSPAFMASAARKLERKEITVRPRQGVYERKKKAAY